MTGNSLGRAKFIFDFGHFPFGVNKEAFGIHVLLMRSLLACDILRRFLRRVSPVKSTSAALRYRWLRRTRPQFGSLQHRWPPERRRGGGAVRHANGALQIVRRLLLPPVSPQELRRYDPQGVKLRPLVLAKMAQPASNRLP